MDHGKKFERKRKEEGDREKHGRKREVVDSGQNGWDRGKDDCQQSQKTDSHVSCPGPVSRSPESINNKWWCQEKLHVVSHVPAYFMVVQLYCFLQDASPSLPHTSHPLLVDPVEIVDVEQVGPPAALAILGQLQYLRALQYLFGQDLSMGRRCLPEYQLRRTSGKLRGGRWQWRKDQSVWKPVSRVKVWLPPYVSVHDEDGPELQTASVVLVQLF